MKRIYVEGIADLKFLKDFIEYHFFAKKDLGKIDKTKQEFISLEHNFLIKSLDGKNNLKNSLTNIKQYYDLGDTIILIFDADKSYEEGLNEITKDLEKHNILNCKIFLFPNNKDSGSLEDLLLLIMKDKEILKCFEVYEKCLSEKSQTYTLPATKTKIYAYLEALLNRNSKENIKEHKRDYKNQIHWSLDHESAAPLKEFLSRIF